MSEKINNNLHENITFFFQEKDDNSFSLTDENFIQQIMDEINQDSEVESEDENNNTNPKLMYFMDKEFYCDDELFYNQEYTVKDLMKICQYYGIEKNIKSSKCKKQDIISTIVYFESLPENYEIVKKRNIMWAYMIELFNDQKMKKYLIWN